MTLTRLGMHRLPLISKFHSLPSFLQTTISIFAILHFLFPVKPDTSNFAQFIFAFSQHTPAALREKARRRCFAATKEHPEVVQLIKK